MTTEDMIRALGNVIEEYKNKPVFTGQTDIPMMCRDVIDKLKELSNPWKTGTPTEEGWYLLKLVDEYGRITYDANYLRKGIKGMEWKYAFFGHVIIKWQSIEDEPEVMMG